MQEIRSIEDWEKISGNKVPGYVGTLQEVFEVLLFWLQQSVQMHFHKFIDGTPIEIEYENYIWSRVAKIRAEMNDEDTFLKAPITSCIYFSSFHVPERLIVPFAVFTHGDLSLRDAGSAIVKQYSEDPATRDQQLLELLGPGHQLDQIAIPWEMEVELDKLLGLPDSSHYCGCQHNTETSERRAK